MPACQNGIMGIADDDGHREMTREQDYGQPVFLEGHADYFIHETFNMLTLLRNFQDWACPGLKPGLGSRRCRESPTQPAESSLKLMRVVPLGYELRRLRHGHDTKVHPVHDTALWATKSRTMERLVQMCPPLRRAGCIAICATTKILMHIWVLPMTT